MPYRRIISAVLVPVMLAQVTACTKWTWVGPAQSCDRSKARSKPSSMSLKSPPKPSRRPAKVFATPALLRTSTRSHPLSLTEIHYSSAYLVGLTRSR